jgi:hypothetical protein
MDKMKTTATKQIPENYVSFWKVNFDSAKATIIANVAAVFAFFLFGYVFAVTALLIRPHDFVFSFSLSAKNIVPTLIFLGEFLVVIVVMMFVHEGFHGLFFWIFSGEKPKFGFKGYYAYAGAPGWYFHRGQYMVIGLAPLAGITLLGILGMIWLPPVLLTPIYLLMVMNASGAVGDMWVVLRLLFSPSDTWALDQGDGVEFFCPAPLGSKPS